MIGFLTTCLIIVPPFACPVFCSSVAQCTTKRHETINGKTGLLLAQSKFSSYPRCLRRSDEAWWLRVPLPWLSRQRE